MKHKVLQLLQDTIDSDIILEKPKDRAFGHYATPIAFSLAKKLKKSPMLIAEELTASLKDSSMFQSVESVKGYINLKLSESFMDEYASWALKYREQYGKANKSGKILLEFVSANPTGPLHVGHARGAVYGDVLLRLGRHLGYEITAEYYVNDAGNQIELLGTSLMLEGQSAILNKEVEWPEKYYRGEYLNTLAKEAAEEFGNDIFDDESTKEKLALWAKDKVLAIIVNDLQDVHVSFDTFVSEASLYNDWDRVLSKIDKGVYKEEGAVLLASSQYQDEKDRVVVRQDGRPTYLAGDIIYHNNKFERDFSHYINIWGADHHGYIARVKAALHFLGYDESKLEVILSQMVSLLQNGEPYKMSKRAGTVILMSDVVKEIGPEAFRYMFASKKCDTALEFDVEDLKKQDSSNPIYYIQYAHARIKTLRSKSTLNENDISGALLRELHFDADSLLFEALLLPEVIEDAFESRQLQKLTDYLKSLASRLHKFYYDHRILGTDEEAKYLKLLDMVALSLKQGLMLLGIEAKESM